VPEQGPLRTDIFGPGGEQPTEQPTVPFARVKWIATGSAVALFGFSLTSYFMAGHEHELLRQDSVNCGTPPCQVFDDAYDHRIQTLGQRWDAIYKVTLVGGVVAAGVAGYFWYKNQSFKVAPAVDTSYAGATAMGRF
jgi:hypothetical protein